MSVIVSCCMYVFSKEGCSTVVERSVFIEICCSVRILTPNEHHPRGIQFRENIYSLTSIHVYCNFELYISPPSEPEDKEIIYVLHLSYYSTCAPSHTIMGIPYTYLGDSADEMMYVNLLLNPERFTGYSGYSALRIWKSIYQENCFMYECSYTSMHEHITH